MLLAESNIISRKYDAATQEINLILNEYKSLKLPTGWNIEIYCYYFLARIYYELNDFNAFIKYYNIIKEKAPEHLFNIELNNFLKSFQIRQRILPPYSIMNR